MLGMQTNDNLEIEKWVQECEKGIVKREQTRKKESNNLFLMDVQTGIMDFYN